MSNEEPQVDWEATAAGFAAERDRYREQLAEVVKVKNAKGLLYSIEKEHSAEVEAERDSLRALNEALRTQLEAALTPLCIGWTTIDILRQEGAKLFDDKRGLIAADDLFRCPDYRAELERLRGALEHIAENFGPLSGEYARAALAPREKGGEVK